MFKIFCIPIHYKEKNIYLQDIFKEIIQINNFNTTISYNKYRFT